MILPRVYSTQHVQKLRNKRLHTEGSPPFEIDISNIAASAQALYGFEGSSLRKYMPFNELKIINEGGTDLKIYKNGRTDGEKIPKNTRYKSLGTLWSFILENLDASSAATGASIFVTVQRFPDQVEAVRTAEFI